MQVGPYETIREIGRGGMGIVFEARAGQGASVALKLIHRVAPASARDRFRREQRLLASLGRDAGFVPVLDAGESDRGPYLVMPLISGGTLRDRLERGPLGIEETLELAIALADAVAHAHRQGIVHRDLKPENILYEGERPLVSDLGLAKHFDQEAPGASVSVQLTRSGETRGTVGYMPPEQMRDAARAGPPADVFALGAIVHECLTGKPAFAGSSPLEVCVRVDAGEHVPLARARPEAPKALAAVIESALSVEPARRPRDAGELARALRASRATKTRGGSTVAVGLVMGALLVFVVVGVTLVTSRRAATKHPQEAVAERATKPAEPEALHAAALAAGLRVGKSHRHPDGREIPTYLWALPAGAGDMELVEVPAGKFTMGSDDPRCGPDDRPQRDVVVAHAFWIGRNPVTRAQYLAFCTATRRIEIDWPLDARDLYPADGLTPDDADAFARWARLALPTVTEWEKAARGDDGRAYPWGNEWRGDRCNTRDDKHRGAVHVEPIGSYRESASPVGALDMAGNVWQWCEAPVPVLRGGGWYAVASDCLSAHQWHPGTGGGGRICDAGARVVLRHR